MDNDQKLLDRLKTKAGQPHPSSDDHPPPRPTFPVRSTRPSAAEASGVLGSRTDAGILLHSGQRLHIFKHQGIVLEGALDIALHLTYLSDQPYRGYFGYGRRFRYEQHLRPLDGAADTWRLYLHDGREFDFTETPDGFLNPGDCPAEVFRQDADTLVLDYFDDRPRETYQNGNLVLLEDRNGNALRLTHRPDNGLTRIDSNSGTSIDLHYNAQNRAETLEDHSGRRWHYRYDAHDNLIAIVDPLGEPVERYDYREFDRPNEPHNHLLETVTDAGGHAWLEAEYDDQGRVIACREGAERNRYHYVHHQLIEKTDAQGGVTIYSLDAHGLISAITRPDGRYQREDYDPTTRIAHITDGDHRHEQHYDERHRLLLVDHGFGEREEYVYESDNPEPVQVTKNGQTTTHAYDDHYNLLSTTAPDGSAEHYAWDERGNLIAHTDGEDHTTAFAYNEQDRVIAVTDPEGHRHQFDYNAQGQPSAHTDPLGHTETFAYDRLGRPTGHTNALGQTTHVYYTATGRVRELIDPDGERTEWAYNTQGQLTEQRRPGGHRQRYHYNDHGLIDAIQRADGSELHIAYNAQKRITELTAWPDPEAENPAGQRQIYRYNNSGQLIEARNGEHQLQQDYTDQGRLTTSTQDGIDLDTWHTADGEHLGGIALLGQSWHYQRDGAGRIEALHHGLHQLQQQHNANGQPVERRYPNSLIEHYTYTDGGQLNSIQEAEEKLPPLEYQHNPLGQIERCNDREYHYGPLGQLVQTNERPYHYNAGGNPIDNEQSYDAQNRLLSDAQYHYRYDGRGNLIEKQHKETQATTEYVWNLFDQLTEVIHTDAEGNVERLCFEYDALGRRVQKGHTQNGETTSHRYLYQGHNLVAILDEKNNLLATILHDQGVDRPLAIITHGHDPKPLTEAQKAGWDDLSEDDQKSLVQQQTERRYYYHRNHQGSITALSDEQGNLVERFEYDAFGNITQHEKTEETRNPFAYTGREFDRADLYYYRARYYDPTQRRFISSDPIELLSGDFNFYRYVGNDPINRRDPFGYKGNSSTFKPSALSGQSFLQNISPAIGNLATGQGVQPIDVVNALVPLSGLMNIEDSAQAIVDGIKENWVEMSIDLLMEILDKVFDGESPEPADNKKKAGGGGSDGTVSKGKPKECEECKKNKQTSSNPVIFTGGKILGDEKELDFSINAPMPLVWQRNYDSQNPRVGLLGQGWTLLSDSHLRIEPDQIIFAEPNGRGLVFEVLDIGESDTWALEQLTLSRPEEELYQVSTGDGAVLHFVPSQTAGRYQLERIADRNGNGLRYIYNYFEEDGHEDRLTHIVTDDARVFALRYLDHLTHVRLAGVDEWRWADNQDRNGPPSMVEAWVNYRYDLHGDLVEVKNHTGRITRQFEYKNHMLVGHKVPEGLESFYEYDRYVPEGKVLHSWSNTGKSWTFEYLTGQTVVTDHEGRQTTYDFDQDEYLTGTTDALGQSLIKELDNGGLPEKIINEAGQEKQFYYDSRGNPILIKDFDGTTLHVSYHDDFNQPVEISDDLDHTTTFAYDDKGNLIEETAADGGVTAYEYDERGLPIVITDAKGGQNQLHYDAAGNLIERTDCSGQTTRYAYDRHSHLTAITDALGQQTQYRYDREHRLIAIHYPDDSTEQFAYNAQGQLIRYTDPKGHATDYELDLEGRPVKRTNALGGELEYRYDAHGRLSQLINENKAAYRFSYDPLDRLIEEQGLDGLVTRYRYDPVGNVTEKHENATAQNPRITAFERDPGGRLTKKHIQQGDQESQTEYQYDELGQLIQAENAQAKVELRYDPLGRLLNENTETPAGRQSQLSHAYDLLGNRTKTQLPNGKALNWLYYGSGHLHQINLDGQVISDYERDALHREVQRTQGNLHSSTLYDPLGRILQQQTLRKTQRQDQDAAAPSLNQQNQSPIQFQRNYRYDKAGELSQIDDLKNGITNYRYDAIGRITQAEQTDQTERFSFDPAHNLISEEQHQAGGYIKDNRLKVYQDKRYDYDTFGNLTEKRIGKHTQMQFRYDLEHQMAEAEVTRNGTTQTFQYAYDPFGRRIAKTDAFGTTHFTWDGNRLLSETRGEKAKTYVYEQDDFVPVAQLDNDNIQYYHTDHLGTPRELTNPEGEIIWETTYTAWGNTVQKSWELQHTQISNELQAQPIRFQGQYFDPETGLHYNRSRYYDPDIGRFVTQDPIGLIGGDNLYQYAFNATLWIDPLGLAPAGNGGAYIFAIKGEGIYIGKGQKKRMQDSQKERGKIEDCDVLVEVHDETKFNSEFNNTLGKMVEYKLMILNDMVAGKGKDSQPGNIINSHVSGKSAYEDKSNSHLVDEADKIAQKMNDEFHDKLSKCTCGF